MSLCLTTGLVFAVTCVLSQVPCASTLDKSDIIIHFPLVEVLPEMRLYLEVYCHCSRGVELMQIPAAVTLKHPRPSRNFAK